MCRDCPCSEINLTTQTIRIVLTHTPLSFQHWLLCKLVTDYFEIVVSLNDCIRQVLEAYLYIYLMTVSAVHIMQNVTERFFTNLQGL
jgi:hypothetical protein